MQSPIKKQLAKKSVTWYWVPDTEKIWVVGEFVEEKNDVLKLTLRDSPSGTINVAKKLCVLITDPSIVTESVDDLISLSQVNDASILNCSRLRFMDKVIYTSIGAVLMAMNPFEVIPNLYGLAKINMYRTLSDENKPSHVYLIPSRAYSALCSFGINQSILISGESGAGKTEATKHCLGFLTTVAVDSSGSDDKNTTNIATRIVAASPILEAFGNAQTIRNPNSSRFGKWMELIFSRSNTIEGSRITSYLLEVNHIVIISFVYIFMYLYSIYANIEITSNTT
jgi:myosin-5